MLDATQYQWLKDEEHLKLLAIFYWISAALAMFVVFYGLFYFGLGVLVMLAPESTAGSGPQGGALAGGIFAFVGLALCLAGIVAGVLQLLAGFWLRQAKHRTLCYVVAALTCLNVPYGTVLGIFTFIVLGRPSVAWRFAHGAGAVQLPTSASASAAAPDPGQPAPEDAPPTA